MVPVGGEETPPVKETAYEKESRETQEANDRERKDYQREFAQINEIFDVFTQRAKIANELDSVSYVSPVSPDPSMEVVFVQLKDKRTEEVKAEYYQPLVYVKKTTDEINQTPAMITADGSIHYIDTFYGSEGLSTISAPDKQGNRYPLIPGADRGLGDEDKVKFNLDYGLKNSQTLSIGKESLKNQRSAVLKDIKEKLIRTANLPKKLVTGEPVTKI